MIRFVAKRYGRMHCGRLYAANSTLVTKLQLGHANVFEALLRQRGIQLESRFLPTRRLTKLELRGQVRDQAGAWSRGCKARLTRRTPTAFIRAAQPGRDGAPCRPGRAQRGGGCRGAHASRVLAKSSRLRELPDASNARRARHHSTRCRKFVAAGRRDQHAGRVRSPEPAASLTLARRTARSAVPTRLRRLLAPVSNTSPS